MRQRLDQIGAAVEFGGARGVGPERAGREVEPFPDRQRRTEPEWEADLMRPVRRRRGWHGAQIGPQILQVGIADFREGRVGKHRKQVGAIRPLAAAHGADEVGFAPRPEAVLRIGCDVRPEERAERRCERAPAGEPRRRIR